MKAERMHGSRQAGFAHRKIVNNWSGESKWGGAEGWGE
jgi:hypothetical protein